MDGAFFKEDVMATLDAHRAQYAIKVPFWRCLDLQTQIRPEPSGSQLVRPEFLQFCELVLSTVVIDGSLQVIEL